MLLSCRPTMAFNSIMNSLATSIHHCVFLFITALPSLSLLQILAVSGRSAIHHSCPSAGQDRSPSSSPIPLRDAQEQTTKQIVSCRRSRRFLRMRCTVVRARRVQSSNLSSLYLGLQRLEQSFMVIRLHC